MKVGASFLWRQLQLDVYFYANYLGLLLKYLRRPMIPAVRPPYTMPNSTPTMTRSISEYDARLNSMVMSVIVNPNNAHVNKEYRCHGGGPFSCDFVRLLADMGTSWVDGIGGGHKPTVEKVLRLIGSHGAIA